MSCWVERLCVKRFWLLPSALTQYGASVSLSILFRSIQDLNSVERKEGDVMALLSMFGEYLHLLYAQFKLKGQNILVQLSLQVSLA